MKFYTWLIHGYVQYEFLNLGFHFLNIEVHPLVDYLQLIQNIFVRVLNISFARRRKALNDCFFV